MKNDKWNLVPVDKYHHKLYYEDHFCGNIVILKDHSDFYFKAGNSDAVCTGKSMKEVIKIGNTLLNLINK